MTEQDVRRAAAPAATSSITAAEERIPFRGKRRMAAKKMVLSKSTIPHALLVDEADVTNLLGMREAMREIGAKEGVKITILPFRITSYNVCYTKLLRDGFEAPRPRPGRGTA